MSALQCIALYVAGCALGYVLWVGPAEAWRTVRGIARRIRS